MKKSTKTLLFSVGMAVTGLIANPVHAQLTSGNAVVTVTVVDVLALAVSSPAVPLSIGTLNDYSNGTSYTATAHLVASSNRPFDIRVRSNGDLEGQLTASGSSIGINNVTVQAAPTTTTNYTAQLSLSAADQLLLSNSPAAMAKTFDVKYATAANNPAFYVKGGAYIATLTYSISAH